MVTTLGSYTDEKYDTTMYHVRTILVDLDASGDVETGNVVIFSSRDALSKDGFDTYARQYLTKDFGDVEMTVSRYTTGFEAVDAFLYRPGQIPLELSTRFEKIGVSSSGKLGKLGANASITGSSTLCYVWCHLQEAQDCAGPLSGTTEVYCSSTYHLICSVIHCSGGGGGSGGGGPGGGGPGGGGPGGGGTSGGDEEEEEEECSCNSQKICDMIDEYEDKGVIWIPQCSDFRTSSIISDFSWRELNGYYAGGNELIHSPYGIMQSRLMYKVQLMRNIYRRPISLSSGYRCPDGNASAGSRYIKTSRHMFGMALDISTGGSFLVFEQLRIIKDQVGGLEHESYASYSDGHLHIEIPGSP